MKPSQCRARGSKPISYNTAKDRALFEEIAMLASVQFGVSQHEIMGKTRGMVDVALVRMAIMYILHVELCWNMTRTGNSMGRDRTTIAYACPKIFDMVDDDDPLTYKINVHNAILNIMNDMTKFEPNPFDSIEAEQEAA